MAARNKGCVGHMALHELVPFPDVNHRQILAPIKARLQLIRRDLRNLALGQLHQLVPVQVRHVLFLLIPNLLQAGCRTARHRGDDGYAIPFPDRGIQAFKRTNFIIVAEHVDEPLDLAVGIQNLGRHARMLRINGLDEFANRTAFDLQLGGTGRQASQGSGNVDSGHAGYVSFLVNEVPSRAGVCPLCPVS